MKRIVVLISEKTNNEAIVSTAIQMAQLFKLDITLRHLVQAPHNWEELGRTARDHYPKAKQAMNTARLIMDQLLLKIRAEKVTAQKGYLLYDADQQKNRTIANSDALVITDRKLFDTKDTALLDFLCDHSPIKLIVSNEFDAKQIEDVVLSSDFHTLLPQSITFVNKLIENLDFNLNLVFIDTNETRENSEISIANMKKAIALNGFRKTTISIFNAECRLKGVERFANLKGGDLIITEERCEVNIARLTEIHLPIIIINKSK